jgi:hypothetical protein
MKLQVKERGAWRDVLTNVQAHEEMPVMEATLALHKAAGGTPFRLFDIRSQTAMWICEGECWRMTRWAT